MIFNSQKGKKKHENGRKKEHKNTEATHKAQENRKYLETADANQE